MIILIVLDERPNWLSPHLSDFHPFSWVLCCPLVCPSVSSSFPSSVHCSVPLSVSLSIHLSVCLSVHQSVKTASIWRQNLVFHPIFSTIVEWFWYYKYFHGRNCPQKHSVCISLPYADRKTTFKSAIHMGKAKKIRLFSEILLTIFFSLLLLKL